MSKNRLENDKPESAFMKDPINVGKATDLVSCQEWDYERIYWFANGSKAACDWVAETLFDREDELYRMTTRERTVLNTIYVSDDIFFLVRKNYERFKYEFEPQDSYLNKFCYIGFFDTVNVARGKALSNLFKLNEFKVNLKIFGKGTEILNKLEKMPNIEIEEGYLEGDSLNYFSFLNSHLAYIFIGKGQSHSRYIGKTVYDAVVARTPVAIYKKCDQKHITFDSDEYYFENEKELKEIQIKLLDNEVRNRWIKDQAEEIFRKLPPSEFLFSNYCVMQEEILDVYVPEIEPSKLSKVKSTISTSISLF